MKTVKNLSVTNIKGTNFVRREDLDFSDDGNRFRGFSYKGLPITTLYSDGRVYCSVEVDYTNNNIPWELWSKTEEYELCDKYNGTSELIDLEDLANICDKVLAKLDSIKSEMNNMDLSEQKSKIWKVLNDEELELKAFIEKAEGFNFFKSFMDNKISDWEIKHIKDYLSSLKNDYMRIIKMISELRMDEMSKKDIIHYAEFASKGFVVLSCKFYIEKITEYMNK